MEWVFKVTQPNNTPASSDGHLAILLQSNQEYTPLHLGRPEEGTGQSHMYMDWLNCHIVTCLYLHPPSKFKSLLSFDVLC